MKYKESLYQINEVHDWSGYDKEYRFDRNLEKFSKRPYNNFSVLVNYENNRALKYYGENPIEYRYNNYGFRTPDDFNDVDDGNVFIGCSHTAGVGHHLENTWSYKLNKDVGGKFWNLSQGGCGIQTDYRLLYGWKDTLKSKNIFHYTVPHPRFEFFNGNELLHLNTWSKFEHLSRTHTQRVVLEFYLEFLSDKEYCNYSQMIYINSIKGLSQEIGCNYYYLTPEILGIHDSRPLLNKDDNSLRARDLLHYSVSKQNYIYEEFKKLWQE